MPKRAMGGLLLLLLGGAAFSGMIAYDPGEDALMLAPAAVGVSGLFLLIHAAFAPEPPAKPAPCADAPPVPRYVSRTQFVAPIAAIGAPAAGAAGREPIRVDIPGVSAAMDALLSRARAEGRSIDGRQARYVKDAVLAILTSDEDLMAPVRDALGEGRFEDAASRLMELGERRAGATADFQHGSAEYFREAGALYWALDPARAVEALEKAWMRDPGHCRTQIWLARLYCEAGRLEAGTDAARSALKCARTDRDRGAAHGEIGAALAAQGDNVGALDHYRRYFAIAHALASRGSGVALQQRDLSIRLNRLGNALADEGHNGPALEAYEWSLAISRGLAAADPGNAVAQRDVNISLLKIGDFLLRQGEDADALAALEEALAISRDLAARDPGGGAAEFILMVNMNTVGDALLARGKRAQALAVYQENVVIARGVAERRAGDAEAQRNLSAGLYVVGDLLFSLGKYAEALDAFRESLAIRRALAAQDPHAVGAKYGVLVNLIMFGDVLLTRKQGAEALAAYEDALAVARDLAAASPASAAAGRDVFVCTVKIGDALTIQGKTAEARAAFEDGLARARAGADSPGDTRARRDLAINHIKIAQLQGEDAQKHWKQAYVLMRELRDAGKLGPEDEARFAQARRNTGMPEDEAS